jgi:signal peptidase II
VGNLIDRIRLGEVVDFIQVGIPPETYWPVFNVADSAVSIGVVWLAVGLVMSGKKPSELLSSEEAPDPEENKVAGVAPSSDEA